MKTFFSNLWADLREKRLWPLAVLLLAAMVAVPVLLKQSTEEPPPAEPVAAQPRSAPEPKDLKGLATVRLEESEAGDGSSLDTFDPSNPFRPPEKVIDEAEEETGEVAAPGDEVTLSDELVEDAPGGGDSGSGGGATGVGDTGGEDTGGDTGEGDGTTTETTEYAYVLDVTFTKNGRTRRVKGMQRLDMLPSTASPLLLFLGVSADAGNAVFLVDSKLETAGEGRCEPSMAECGFLHLGAGSEHMFTNQDGDTYRLRVDQIRKVKVIEEGAKQAKAALKASGAPRRFSSPLISDLVSVSSTKVDNSTRGGDRR
jgi:hypothetical protein